MLTNRNKKSVLTPDDKKSNEIALTNFFQMATKHLPMSTSEIEIFDFLKVFMEEENITLHARNLFLHERDQLIKIIKEMLQSNTNRVEEFRPSLEGWKRNLQWAVCGQGELAKLHAAQSSGIIADLKAGKVPANKLLTDLDLQQALAKDITYPENIKVPGKYILPTCSITEDSVYKDQLATVKKSVARSNVTGTVTVLTGLNYRNYHWGTGRVQLECDNGQITQIKAEMWDPMFGIDKQGKNKPEFALFKSAINTLKDVGTKVKSKFTFGNVQHDGSSCGVHTYVHLKKEAGKSDAITRAPDVRTARFEMTKKLADKEFDSTFVNSLQMNARGEIAPAPKPVVKVKPTPVRHSIESILKEPSTQILFDSVYAKKLQSLYDANVDEVTATKKARDYAEFALRKLSIFKPATLRKDPAPALGSELSRRHKIK